MLSDSFIKPLINYAHITDASNITAIGNPITIPVDLNGFSLDNKKKQILYVGRMDYENKRVNRIVEAWQDIAEKYEDWSLILVGDGPHKQKLIDYVKKNNVDRVKFEGFQVEPPIRYYKDASIFMLTSDLEGFGLVIIESMSFGCVPIVYGSYEAAYDIIDQGQCGFVTPKPYKKSETIKKMETLINDDTLRREMAIKAMEKAKKFSIDSISKKWYDLFEEILK
jgi:glycosyltransferase involved in cell wall biosynthesis